MKKGYALIYDSIYEAMQYCTMEERGILFSALVEYQLDGTMPDINGLLMGMFMQAKSVIDNSEKKYKQCVENGKKGAEYGKLGGRPKKTSEESENENPKETPKKPQKNPKETPTETPKPLFFKTPYKEKEKENIYITSLDREVCENSEDSDFTLSPSLPPPKVDYDRVVDLYHTICKDYPKIIKLSDQRRQKIRIRFADEMKSDYSTLENVFRKMQDSKFMRGDNRQGWKASFDWVFENGSNWVKVLEGNYDNKITNISNSKTYPQWA